MFGDPAKDFPLPVVLVGPASAMKHATMDLELEVLSFQARYTLLFPSVAWVWLLFSLTDYGRGAPEGKGQIFINWGIKSSSCSPSSAEVGLRENAGARASTLFAVTRHTPPSSSFAFVTLNTLTRTVELSTHKRVHEGYLESTISLAHYP